MTTSRQSLLFGTASHLPLLQELINDLKSLSLKIIFVNESVKPLDFRALSKFLKRIRELIRLREINRTSIFGQLNFVHSISPLHHRSAQSWARSAADDHDSTEPTWDYKYL